MADVSAKHLQKHFLQLSDDMVSNDLSTPSTLIEDLRKLNRFSNPDKNPTEPLPGRPELGNNRLVAYVTEYRDPIKFLPQFDIYATQTALQAAHLTWTISGQPVLAVCALPKTTEILQRTTGINAVGIDAFFSDFQRTRRLTEASGKAAFVVRNYSAPHGPRDRVLVPANATLLVYQPHAMSTQQLDRLYTIAKRVDGSVIFCDRPDSLKHSHPTLYDQLRTRLIDVMEPKLVHDPLPPYDLPKKHEKSSLEPSVDDHARVQFSQIDLASQREKFFIFHVNDNDPVGPRLVATLSAESLPQALSRAQHFDYPWPENPDVTLYQPNPRSTDVGDIIVFKDTAHLIAKGGFEPTHNPFKEADSHSHKETHSVDVPTHDPPKPDAPTRKIKLGF